MEAPNQHIKIIERVATRLKLKQLRLLVAIDEHASILHAAKALNLSQPAATKLLQDLEIDFGVSLFDRTNRGVTPTAFGRALVRHGKLILAQISHAAQELDDLNQGLGGRVVVGTLLVASAALLPAAIERVRRLRPNVSIVIRDGTNDVLMPALRSGDVDLVVGRLPDYRYREEVVQETLLDEQLCIVARSGHPLCQARTIRFADLIDCAWILPPQETTLRRQIDKEFLDHGCAPPANAVESVSFLTNRRLLMNTDMLAVVPYHVMEHEVRQGVLGIVPCKLKLGSGQVGVSYRRQGGLSPAAVAFLDELRIAAQNLNSQPE